MLEPEAQDLKLTVLVDNVVDIFQPSIGPWSYPVAGPASSLWGEQGLSLLVEATGSRGESVRVLYDFGRSGPVLNHNLKILRPDGAGADLLMLSHGHIDHYGGLGAYLNEGGRGAPLLTHPASFGSRGIRRPDGGLAGPWVFEKRSLLDWGLEVRTSTVAQQLGPGLWSTGSIPRFSSLDVHLDQAIRFDQEGRLLPDALEDDQALVALVAGLGLVVITGCCHAGAINTLDAAAAMFPGQPLYALIGGLHLNHLTEDQARAVAREIEARDPRWVLPMHCTGAMATRILHQTLGPRCLADAVGLTLDTRLDTRLDTKDEDKA